MVERRETVTEIPVRFRLYVRMQEVCNDRGETDSRTSQRIHVAPRARSVPIVPLSPQFNSRWPKRQRLVYTRLET